MGYKKERKTKVFKKNFQKNTYEKQKEVVSFAPAERHADTVSQTREKNKKNTFLDILNDSRFKRDLRQRIESNRIERFEKPL
jgi:hypothetical protein